MADPVSLGVSAALSLGSTLIGGATKAAGDLTSAQGNALTAQGQAIGAESQAQNLESESQAYQYKAGMALFNKTIADQNASYAFSSGDIEAENKGLQARQEIAGTKAAQAGTGVDVNTGSAAAVRDTQMDVAENDQNTIRANAARKVYGFQIEGAKDVAEAGLDTAASTNALRGAAFARQGESLDMQKAGLALQAGNISALGSIVGTGMSVASKWLQASSSGVFGGGNVFGGANSSMGDPTGIGGLY